MKTISPQNYILVTVFPLLAFSLVLIGFPTFIASVLQTDTTDMGDMMLQFLGASLAGHAYLNYKAISLHGDTLRQVYGMNIIALAIASTISGLAAILSNLSVLAYLILVMHVGFLSGFIFFYRRIT